MLRDDIKPDGYLLARSVSELEVVNAAAVFDQRVLVADYRDDLVAGAYDVLDENLVGVLAHVNRDGGGAHLILL